MKYLLLYIFVVVCSTTLAQQKLEYRLTVGDSFSVKQEASQVITQDINGVDQIIQNDLMGIMQFSVLDKSADYYTLSMSFKRLKMLMTSPSLGELLNADTDSKDLSDTTSNLFKGILNIPVTIIMNTSGKIKSVTGGDKIIENMFVSAEITDPEVIEASRDQMEKQFGSAALSNSIEQMTYFYPKANAASNKEWRNSYTGALTADNIWTLSNNAESKPSISGSSKTIMSSIDDTMVMTLSGSQQTTVLLDPNTGLFNSIIVKGENTGSTLFKAQNISIPTRITSSIIYKITQ